MQLRVRVVEGRQLQGNNISPVCRVSIRRQVNQTDVCPSTNSPVWNKSFAFTFHVSPAEIVDDILMFEVYRYIHQHLYAVHRRLLFSFLLVYRDACVLIATKAVNTCVKFVMTAGVQFSEAEVRCSDWFFQGMCGRCYCCF